MAVSGGGSWVGYVVGGVVFAVAAAVAVAVAVLGFTAMVDRIDELQRVPASEAGATLALAGAGRYTVYFEAPGVNDGQVGVPRVAITPVDGAQPIDLRPYSGDFTYDFGGHEGRAVATFRTDRPGSYRVRATGVDTAGAEIAVGRSVGGGLGRALARAVVIGGTGLLVGGGIAVWTAIRQSKAASGPAG